MPTRKQEGGMRMPTDTGAQARKTVIVNMKRERQELQRQLRDALKTEKEVARRQQQASDRYWKLMQKNGLDSEPDDKEREAARANDLATNAYLGVTRKIEVLQRKLTNLDDPGELERRVQDEQRKIIGLAQLREHKAATAKPKGARKMAATVEIPEPVGNRIKKMLEEGKSTGEVAAKLKSDKVPPVFYDEWSNRSVRRTYKVFTGKTNIPAKAKTAGRKTLSERKPAPTRKVQATARKTGSVEKAAARVAQPLSKTAQARGTSRGGTGSRKKKTVARKR